MFVGDGWVEQFVVDTIMVCGTGLGSCEPGGM